MEGRRREASPFCICGWRKWIDCLFGSNEKGRRREAPPFFLGCATGRRAGGGAGTMRHPEPGPVVRG
jgi:hypothetical protein